MKEIGDLNKFDPDKLINNEIQNGDGQWIVKIPKIKGRIARKETDHGTYIQFIHDRVYDPEKKQSRNRKTIIGLSVEDFLRGMMQANDRYYSFFNHDGKLIYKPTTSTPEQETDDPDTLALEEVEYEPDEPDTATPEEMEQEPDHPGMPAPKDGEQEPNHPGVTASQEAEEEPDEPDTEEKPLKQSKPIKEMKKQTETTENPIAEPNQRSSSDPNQKPAREEQTSRPTSPQEEKMSEQENETRDDEASIPYTKRQLLNAYQDLKRKYDDLEMRCIVESEQAQDDHIRFLWKMLIDFQHAIEPQARKKPDTPMSPRQIQQIEALLRELRDIFQDAEGEEYLKSAAAPDADSETADANSEETGPVTYGEMQLILAPYENMIHTYTMHSLWKKGKS